MKRKTREDLPLGRLARDVVSGFTGIIESRTEWLNGCFRVALAPNHLDKDGKMLDSRAFDAEQIELLPAQVRREAPGDSGGPVGGPMPDAVRQGEQ